MSKQALHSVFDKLKEAAWPIFTMQCTAVRNGALPLSYLDLEIVESNGSLVINPSYNKEVIPLNISSAHPSFVHQAWPAARDHGLLWIR